MFLLYFDQINAALVSIRKLIKKNSDFKCPAPRIENVPNVTPLCRIEPNREFCEPLPPSIHHNFF